MTTEQAIKLLKEMQENCKNKKIYKDEKAEAKAEAIEVVLKELDKKDKAIKKIEEEKSKKNTVKTFYFRNGDSLLLPFIVSEEICENYLFVRTKDNEETVYDINLKEINFIKTEYKENF